MQNDEPNLQISRRKLLAAAGFGGAAITVGGMATEAAHSAPIAVRTIDPVATPPVAGLHLQFGADASTQVVASWHTLQPVHNPRVILGRLDGKFERTVKADTVSYSDAKTNQVVFAHHAKLNRLKGDSDYLYGAVHDNAVAEFGSFRTAPRGRARITFTSFGDQGTPTLGTRFK